MKAIRLGAKIIQTLVRDRIYYPSRLIVDTFTIIARCGVLLILYWYVFQLHDGVINNIPYIIAAWSMFFYFAFLTFRLRDISRIIMQDVQSGNIEILFNRPISYILYRIWWQIGAGLYLFVIISVVSSITLAFLIGIPETMMLAIFIPTLILVILLGTLLVLFLYLIVGLLAFWIEDINPVFWIVDKAVMILGGSYLPVALFPDFMYKIAVWSPFGASQFITHTVYEAWAVEWIMKIGIQLFWVIILVIIAFVLYTKARENVSINGG